MKISIIIPVYNEKNNLRRLLSKVKKTDFGNFKKEIILVDDFSTDGTRKIIQDLKDKEIKRIYQDRNYGKGFAIRTALRKSTGQIVIIQDADFEYNPREYRTLIRDLLKDKKKVVYGSRFIKKNKKYRINSFFIANKFLSYLTSALYLHKITDMETCYKAFEGNFIRSLKLECNRFDFEPEVTAKILKRGIKIQEIPISYNPRNKSEGKKIKWRDGFRAVWILFKYRIKN